MAYLILALAEGTGAITPGWDITNASYDSVAYDVLPQDNLPRGVNFSPDGLHMFVPGEQNGRVYHYTLTTPFDVSSGVSFSDSTVVSGQGGLGSPTDSYFSSDGTKMYIVGGSSSDSIYQYTLSTPWVVSSASYDNISINVNFNSGLNNPRGMFIRNDGTKLYVVGTSAGSFTLSTPWDLSSATYDANILGLGTEEPGPTGIFFKPDGTKMYIVGVISDSVTEYTLSTPWVLTTGLPTNTFSFATEAGDVHGVAFNSGGTKMFITHVTGGLTPYSILQYSL
jgi:hypothetical protein